MKLYVEINGKIIGEFDIMRESLGDFLKRKKLGTNFEMERKDEILSLKTIKDKSQLELKM